MTERNHLRRTTPLAMFIGLGACATIGVAPAPSASMGLLIANERCAACHQTGGGGESPNPDAPTFEAIANRSGMTEAGLAAFLRDSHNYPIEMGFRLESHEADSLAAYMARWRNDAPAPGS